MYKIIGGDHKEYGPASSEELLAWIAEGRLSGQSLVQLEGSGEWKPLSAFPEFADALRAQTGQTPSPAAPYIPASPEQWNAEVLARQPRVQIGSCLTRSGQLLSANFGLLAGASALAWLLSLVSQFIPFLGGIVYVLLEGVLYGGLYLVFLKRIRGEPASVNEVFSGFNINFVQLMLVGFLTWFLSSIGFLFCMVPWIYLTVAWVFSIPLVADKRLEFWSAMELSRKVVTRVWFDVLALLLIAFLPLVLMFIFSQVKIFSVAYPGFQEILNSGQFDFKRLMDLATHVAKTSLPLALLNKVVLLFNLPFAAGALMYAYEDLFGTRTAPKP